MDRELRWRISVLGQAEAIREIRSVTAAAKADAEAQIKLAEAVGRARVAAAKAGGEALRGGFGGGGRAGGALSDAERAKREAADVQRSVDRAQQASAARRLSMHRQEQRELARAKDREVRDFERAEREKTKIAQREAENIQKFVDRAQQASAARQLAMQRQAQREAERAHARADRDAMFDRKRLFRGVAGGVVDGVGGAIGTAAHMAWRGVRDVQQGLGLGGAFDIAGIVQERQKIQEMLRAVKIEARGPGGRFSGSRVFDKDGKMLFDESAGMRKIRETAKATGISQEDLASAINAGSEKGSGALTLANIDRIAKQAKAMGSSAETVARLRSTFDVQNKGLTGKDMDEGMKDRLIAKMHFLGKTGVFRAEDFAEQGEALFASFGKHGMSFEKDFDQFVAFSNEARKSVGNPAEAKTAIKSALDQVTKRSDKLHAYGISTKNKDGSERNPIEVIKDAIVAAKGDNEKLSKIFDVKSATAMTSLTAGFNAAGGAKDAKAGRARLDEMLSGGDDLKGASVAEMMKDANEAIASEANQLKIAMETVRQTISEKLEPVLARFAANIGPIVDHVTKAIDFIAKHPVLAAVTAGAAGGLVGAAPTLAKTGVRFAGDTLAGLLPGKAGTVVGAINNTVNNAIASATATHVWVENWPANLGGGGGGGPVPGAGVVSEGAVSAALAAVAGPLAALITTLTLGAVFGTDSPTSDEDQDRIDKMMFEKYGQEDTSVSDEEDTGVSDSVPAKPSKPMTAKEKAANAVMLNSAAAAQDAYIEDAATAPVENPWKARKPLSFGGGSGSGPETFSDPIGSALGSVFGTGGDDSAEVKTALTDLGEAIKRTAQSLSEADTKIKAFDGNQSALKPSPRK